MKNLKRVSKKLLFFCSFLLPFSLLSCHNSEQNRHDHNFYTDDCYFIVDDFLGGVDQGEAMSTGIYHVLTVKSLSHKNLLQEKISWSFIGVSKYDIKPQFFEKKGRNNSDVNFYLRIDEASDEFEVILHYYDLSFGQSFSLCDNHLETKVLLSNSHCFIDLDNPEYSTESAFIFNSNSEYESFKQSSIPNTMPNLSPYNINFEHYSLAVFCGFYSMDHYSFEFMDSFVFSNHVYFQSIITLPDNDSLFDPIACKSYYLLIDKTHFNECSQHRLFSFVKPYN